MTNAYKSAFTKNRGAVNNFNTAQANYSERKISDVEFLAALKEYDSAMAALDKAFHAEAGRVISV